MAFIALFALHFVLGGFELIPVAPTPLGLGQLSLRTSSFHVCRVFNLCRFHPLMQASSQQLDHHFERAGASATVLLLVAWRVSPVVGKILGSFSHRREPVLLGSGSVLVR